MAEIFNVSDPNNAAYIPEGCCLLAYRGSIAHNMYIPGTDPNSIDDVDLIGVVVGQTEHYLGLHEWGSRGTKEVKEGKYDIVYYEMKKMFSLLLQGNPNVLSMLWLRNRDYLYLNDAGRAIVDNRELFIGKHAYNAFAGYAYQQLSKMESRDPVELRDYLALTAEAKYRGIHPNEKGICLPRPVRSDPRTGEERTAAQHSDDVLLARLRHYMKKGDNTGYMGDKRKNLVLEHGYDAKNASHCVRLLRMAAEFLCTGELVVFRPDAAELLDIKRGKWPLSRVKAHAEDLFSEMKEARENSPLPEEPKRDEAEKLLVSILRKQLL